MQKHLLTLLQIAKQTISVYLLFGLFLFRSKFESGTEIRIFWGPKFELNRPTIRQTLIRWKSSLSPRLNYTFEWIEVRSFSGPKHGFFALKFGRLKFAGLRFVTLLLAIARRILVNGSNEDLRNKIDKLQSNESISQFFFDQPRFVPIVLDFQHLHSFQMTPSWKKRADLIA